LHYRLKVSGNYFFGKSINSKVNNIICTDKAPPCLSYCIENDKAYGISQALILFFSPFTGKMYLPTEIHSSFFGESFSFASFINPSFSFRFIGKALPRDSYQSFANII